MQVCVSATRREGILGQLLCSLSRVRLSRLSLADVAMLANRAVGLVADGRLSGRDIAQLRQLLNRLVRV